MGPAVRPIVRPQPTAGATVVLVCAVIFPSLWSRSHFEVVLASVRAACTLLALRHHFGWAPAKSVLEGVGLEEKLGVRCVVPAKSMLVHCGKACAATLETSANVGWVRGGRATEVSKGRLHC